MLYVATIFLPLIGAIAAGLFGRWVGDRGAQLIACGMMVLSGLFSIIIFRDVALDGNERVIELFTWIRSGGFEASWALKFDTLSAVMVFVVSVVSALIHIYSIGYMAKDPSIPRFFSYLSLFTFFMLMLVSADNLVQLFFGWEGVGLCSYLLIGFWYDRDSANAAAIKAFVLNRIGDFGFALGIFAVFYLFGSVSFETIFAAAPAQAETSFEFLGLEVHALTLICLLLFIGAMGKSAQIGLHVWLPDAMEGPTPVSALIHAATMVTAGVFMVVRMSPLFELAPSVLALVAVIGALTAFMAGTIALAQNDIKRVIAYSTCSQLGYMFFAIGVSAYGAAIFHLMTHAFFKSLLFLGSGSVIHAMSDEQDMRKMGGIWRKIPLTYAVMWVGSLALVGIPFFAGYYSKDIIIESAWGAHSLVGNFAYVIGVVVAFLTAFYSCRLLFMTFHGEPRADEKVMAHVHESPKVMTVPLVLLAVGAIFSGSLGYDLFVGDGGEGFWRASILVLPGHDALAEAHHAPWYIKLTPLVLAVLGMALAFLVYFMFPGLAGHAAERFPRVHAFLYNKWYFDEIYDRLLVRPALILGRGLWKSGDGELIDGIGPDGIAASVMRMGRRAAALQSGYVYHYAFAMIIGVVGFISWYLYGLMG
ncbi:MAG: NADH-quinone oxidoreductase subunit L [Alphaproteobacteria bacterium]|nr:NADH-quinone oxidoreductase subunit L [Alphaproteobacteria bacterium]